MTSLAFGFSSCLLRTLYWSDEYGDSPWTSPPQTEDIPTHILLQVLSERRKGSLSIKMPLLCSRSCPSEMIQIKCSDPHELWISYRMQADVHGVHLINMCKQTLDEKRSQLQCPWFTWLQDEKPQYPLIFIEPRRGGHTDSKSRENGD